MVYWSQGRIWTQCLTLFCPGVDKWEIISNNFAKLEAGVKDEIDGLDSADKGEKEKKDEDEDTKNGPTGAVVRASPSYSVV